MLWWICWVSPSLLLGAEMLIGLHFAQLIHNFVILLLHRKVGWGAVDGNAKGTRKQKRRWQKFQASTCPSCFFILLQLENALKSTRFSFLKTLQFTNSDCPDPLLPAMSWQFLAMKLGQPTHVVVFPSNTVASFPACFGPLTPFFQFWLLLWGHEDQKSKCEDLEFGERLRSRLSVQWLGVENTPYVPHLVRAHRKTPRVGLGINMHWSYAQMIALCPAWAPCLHSASSRHIDKNLWWIWKKQCQVLKKTPACTHTHTQVPGGKCSHRPCFNSVCRDAATVWVSASHQKLHPLKDAFLNFQTPPLFFSSF